jgi:hypothetical protein
MAAAAATSFRSGSMRLAVVSGPMCAAVIVVLVAVPSQASKSCMTQGEARAQLPTAHLYWHGPGHCWDATAPRHGLVHRIKQQEHREAQVEEPKESGAKWREAQVEEPKESAAKWRDSMSEMLADEAAAAAPVLRTAPQADGASEAPSPGPNWLDRWVDITQVVPSALLALGPDPVEITPATGLKVELLVTPTRVVFAFLALVLTIAVIELIFRSTIRDGRRS